MLLREGWLSHITPRLESPPIAEKPGTSGLFAAPSEVVFLFNRQLCHPDTLLKAALGDSGPSRQVPLAQLRGCHLCA